MSVLATSLLVTGTREEAVEDVETAGVDKNSEKSKGKYPENLARVPCIRYLITFWKKFVCILVLFDLGNEVNVIHSTFAQKLRLPIRPTDVRAQKIDDTTLDIYKMVVTAFSMMDKANQLRFFKKTFLVANVSPKVIFGILFLTLSGIDIDFLGRKLRWKIYTTKKTLSTTRRVKLVGKKEFTAAVFDLEDEIFVIHIVSVKREVAHTKLSHLQLQGCSAWLDRMF